MNKKLNISEGIISNASRLYTTINLIIVIKGDVYPLLVDNVQKTSIMKPKGIQVADKRVILKWMSQK